MLSLSILCLWLASPSSASTMIEPAQLKPQHLYAVANHGHRSLVLYGEMDDAPATRLYLYDFEQKQGRRLDETYLTGQHGGMLVAGTKGWYLWQGTDRDSRGFTVFSHAGEWLEQINAGSIKGWHQDYGMRAMYSYGQNKALLTLTKSSGDQKTYPKPFPALLDLATLTLTPLTAGAATEIGTQWVPFEDSESVLQIDVFGGGMTLTTLTQKDEKTLRPNCKPLEKNRNNSAMTLRSPVFQYKKHYHFIMQQKDSISCEQVIYNDKGEYDKTIALTIDPHGRIQEQANGLLVRRYQATSLIFDRTSSAISLVATTKSTP